jgi:uncharacterized DUF497 family protein
VASSFDIQFEWDPRKAQTNRSKHGVSFENAATVFADRDHLTMHDAVHSAADDRWVTLGVESGGKLIVVVHTWEDVSRDEARVRIISARAATARERAQYKTSR